MILNLSLRIYLYIRIVSRYLSEMKSKNIDGYMLHIAPKND